MAGEGGGGEKTGDAYVGEGVLRRRRLLAARAATPVVGGSGRKVEEVGAGRNGGGKGREW